MEEKIIKGQKNRKELLECIKQLKENCVNLKLEVNSEEQEKIFDSIINSIDRVLNENEDEQEHKNIGNKINKFNYEKYINCREELEKMDKLADDFTSNNNERDFSSFFKLKFEAIKESIKYLKEDVLHKISTYENGKK